MRTKAIFSPYGAFEMKASYQRNMLIGNLSVVIMAFVIIWIASLFDYEKKRLTVKPRGIICQLIDQRKLTPIDAERLRPKKKKPEIKSFEGAIPIPVPDVEYLEIDNTEFEDVITPTDVSGTAGEGLDNNIIGSGNSDGIYSAGGVVDTVIYPGETEFVPFEEMAEMLYYEQPVYPRLCKLAGIEGKVVIKVLVGKDGLVKKVIVAHTSGNESLDQAAVAAAKENRFSPALQNSIPISLWVSYTVTFTLE